MVQAASAHSDGRAVQPGLADHDQAGFAALVRGPRPVVVMVDALPDALDGEAHRPAGDRGEALDPEDVVRGRNARQALGKGVRRYDFPERHVEGFEVVVLVVVLVVMVRRPGGEIVLRRRIEAEQDRRIDRAFPGRDHPERAAGRRGDRLAQRPAASPLPAGPSC